MKNEIYTNAMELVGKEIELLNLDNEMASIGTYGSIYDVLHDIEQLEKGDLVLDNDSINNNIISYAYGIDEDNYLNIIMQVVDKGETVKRTVVKVLNVEEI